MTYNDMGDGGSITRASVIPFALRTDKTPAGTLKWLNEEFDLNLTISEVRLRIYRNYNDLYSSKFYNDASSRATRDSTGELNETSKKPRKQYNYIHEMVETRVSQASRRTSSLTVIPRHGTEESDKNAARAAETLLESKRRELSLDAIHSDADRSKLVLGDCFLFTTWDKDKGPRKKDGKAFERMGDVCVRNVSANHVFPEPRKKKFEDLNYITEVRWENVHEIKAMYPKAADAIQIQENRGDTNRTDGDHSGAEGDTRLYWNLCENDASDDQIPVKYFYHRATRHLPEGKFIKWVSGAILEQSDLKDVASDTGELPCVKDADLDMLDQFWGKSHIVNTENLQTLSNSILNSVTGDFGANNIGRHFIAKGSGVKSEDLSNESRVVTFNGQVPPVYLAPAPTNPQAIPFFELLGRLIGKQSSVYEITRGEVPKGVTANSALRFLDEQESNRTETSDKKKAERQRKVAMMILATVRTHYKDSDKRIARVIGKGKQHLAMAIKEADFEKIDSIDIQNTSSLPKTKSGKIAAITDLNLSMQSDPPFRRKEILSHLDLANEEAFITGATVAVDTATFMLDQILKGKEVPEISMADDLLVHYSVLDKEVQSISFKISEEVTKEIRAVIVERMMTIERLLFEQAAKSPRMLQELLTLESFPKFFEPEVTLYELQQQFMVAGGPLEAGGINAQQYRNQKLKEQEESAS